MIELRAPLIAELAVTGFCNLQCTYCYARDLPKEEMDYRFCTSLVADLFHRGVFVVILAGGEPFMHTRILDIVDTCARCFGDRVSILSNGVCLADDGLFREFSSITNDNYSQYGRRIGMQLSLDSVLPEQNEIHRGKTAEVVEVINRVAGLPVNLCIGTVVTGANLRAPIDIIHAFYPRVRQFHHMRLLNCRAENALDGLDPSDVQISLLKRELLSMEATMPDLRLTGFTRETGPSNIKYPGCLAGVTRLYIDPAGNVLPCGMATNHVWGNLHVNRFEDIWFSETAERARNGHVALCGVRGAEC